MLGESHRLALPSNDEYSVPQLRMMIRKSKESSDARFPWVNGIGSDLDSRGRFS